jgi:hypothetical protein
METWSRDGNDFLESFQDQLKDPDDLKYRFENYKKRFGKDFTMRDFIELIKTYAIAEHARVLGNIPELLSHYFYVMPIAVRLEKKGGKTWTQNDKN